MLGFATVSRVTLVLSMIFGIALIGIAVATLPATVARADELVGADGCGSCHTAALEAWRRGPHARAALRLSEVQKQDPRCQTCHAPHGREGITGVQCETCHGQGISYARAFVMRDAELARLVGLTEPTQALCLRCHAEAPSLRTFVFDEARSRIRHWPKAP